MKDITERNISASYCGKFTPVDQYGWSIYDKHEDFNLHIPVTHFPFPSSNIPPYAPLEVYCTAKTIRQCILLLWMFYSEGHVTFKYVSQTGISMNAWKGHWESTADMKSQSPETLTTLHRSGKTLTLYIYCPIWRETWRFVPPRKFMSPEGDMNFRDGTNLYVSRLTGQLIVYYTESWNTTFYSAERYAVRHDRETRHLEGDTTMCLPSTWLL